MTDPVETKQCTNCKIEILSSNYTVHCLHCIKNIYLCDKCEEPVNYNKKIDHDQTNHIIVSCSSCNIGLEKYLLKNHMENGCAYRKVKCQICDIEVTATDISEHENYCGSRTEKCSECGEFVMLRYKSLHIDSNHTFIKLSDEPGPSPSWQNGRRTLYNFMPDLSSKIIKPVTSSKRKSSEHIEGSRNFDNSASDNSVVNSPQETMKENFDGIFNEKDNSQFKAENFSKMEVDKTSSKTDVDEWPALSSLRSLHISEEKQNNQTGTETSSSSQTEESDLMYAIQVSQKLNSHIWFKHSNTGNEEVSKNSYEPLAENFKSAEKIIQKSMFDRNIKNDIAQSGVSLNDMDNLHDKQERVKLPCEFCGTLIVSNELILHQSMCSLNVFTPIDRRRSGQRVPYFEDDERNWEKKIACGICNKVLKCSLLESHELQCRRNPKKLWKNQDKGCYSRNMKSLNVKSEPGIQNGIEPNSPKLSRVGTRSEWLSELTKSTEGKQDLKNNLNYPDTGVANKTVKASRKNKKAPSPPRR